MARKGNALSEEVLALRHEVRELRQMLTRPVEKAPATSGMNSASVEKGPAPAAEMEAVRKEMTAERVPTQANPPLSDSALERLHKAFDRTQDADLGRVLDEVCDDLDSDDAGGDGQDDDEQSE